MSAAALNPSLRDLSHLKVLLVDDNPHMLTLLRRILVSMRVKHVTEMTDASDAFKALPHLAPDIVFVDWVMSPVDGCAFVKLVRGAEDLVRRNLPIVMVTAHTEEYRIKAAVAAGVNGFLAKPISPQMVYQRICAALDDPRPLNQRHAPAAPAEAARA